MKITLFDSKFDLDLMNMSVVIGNVKLKSEAVLTLDIRKDSQVGFGVKIKADEPPLERCFTQMSIYDYSGLEIACRSNMQISTFPTSKIEQI